MVQAIRELLQTLEVTQPSEAGGLQVFGLRRRNGQALKYMTLDEALAAGTLQVSNQDVRRTTIYRLKARSSLLRRSPFARKGSPSLAG